MPDNPSIEAILSEVHGLPWTAKASYLKSLPVEVFAEHSLLLRQLPVDDATEIFLSLIASLENKDREAVCLEYLNIIHGSGASYRKSEFLRKLPDELLIYFTTLNGVSLHIGVMEEMRRRDLKFDINDVDVEYALSDSVWGALSHEHRWRVVWRILNRAILTAHDPSPSVKSRVSNFGRLTIDVILSNISENAILDSGFLKWVNPNISIDVSIEKWNSSRNYSYIDIIKSVFDSGKVSYVPIVYARMSNHDLEETGLIAYLRHIDPEKQAERLWACRESGVESIWQYASVDGKVLTIYRFAKEGTPLLSANDIRLEGSRLVRSLLILHWLAKRPDKRAEGFQSAHTLLEEHIIDQAWKEEGVADVGKVLPECSLGQARHCEARYYILKEDQVAKNMAYCPRLPDHKCTIDAFYRSQSEVQIKPSGARLYPITTASWNNWSLLELLQSSMIEPVLPSLQDPSLYVQKMSGWVNRLIELRDRMRCRKCKVMMKPNVAYAKFLAKFNMTVATCRDEGEGHDRDVYFNECWNCHSIIDSRESRHRTEKYYLCISCGAGPRSSKQYKIGSLCPSCGSDNLIDRSKTTRQSHYKFECSSCRHIITGKKPREERSYL